MSSESPAGEESHSTISGTWRKKQHEKPAWMQPHVRAAVPCLSPKHSFCRMEGPERLLRLIGCRAAPAILSDFLSTFSPSKASCSDVAWIAADRDEMAGQVR